MRPLIVACFLALASSTASATDLIPLTDLGTRPYRLGYIGGLYDAGSNTMPPEHLAAGLERARLIQPLDENGQPSLSGKVVMLTIGTGDTNRVICALYPDQDCEAGSFTSMVRTSRRVNPALVVINAASKNLVAGIADDVNPLFDSFKDRLLLPAGVTEQQVQVGWMQMSYPHPTVDITCACSDTYNVNILMANSLRAMAAHYPNLRIVYLSSRPFAGYTPETWNTEPYAYDNGIMMRIVIVEQIRQVQSGFTGGVGRIGDINYLKGNAPWIAWGPYMWANGMTPRSDGLTWVPEDYDGEFLSERGAHKAAMLLFNFLATDPTARSWFLAPGASSRPRSVRH